MGERLAPKFSLGPFDSARFEALAEGLEVSVVQLSVIDEGNPAMRLDSEFFARVSLAALAQIASLSPEPLVNLVQRIQHPLEVPREYGETGLSTLMAGNVRPNRADFERLPRMAVERSIVSRNRLSFGDVVVVRSGANFGTVAAWKSDVEAYACADLLVARAPTVPAGFLSTYLTSRYGKPLMDRCAYGSAQPHVSPLYVGLIQIPRIGLIEDRTDELVHRAIEAERIATCKIAEAEDALLDALGLRDWSPPEPLSYTASAARVLALGRLDSQYYMPAKTEMMMALAGLSDGTVSDSFDSVRDMVDPTKGDRTRIVRNYDLTDALQPVLDATLAPVPLAQIDSQKKRIQDGDLAVSRLRSYLREIAVARVTDDIPAIGSSEFFVLRHRAGTPPISAEAMMIYLRAKPVQTILKWCQDGSQHPRFAERDLLAIPLPRAVAELNEQITSSVCNALDQRARSIALLATARRAVEIAIEDGEAAALAHLDDQG